MTIASKTANKLFFIASFCLFFLLPFNGKVLSFFSEENSKSLLPICISIMFILGFFTEKFTILKLKENWVFKGFAFLFCLYLISAVFVHADKQFLAGEIAKKFSFLVIPFILISNRFFFVKHKKVLFFTYFAGVLLTLVYLDIKALYCFQTQGFIPLYAEYSCFTHPTYLGCNILVSIIFLFGRIVNFKGVSTSVILQFILLAILFLHLMMLLSKAVLISAIIVMLFFFFYLMFQEVKKMFIYLIVFSLPLGIIMMMPSAYDHLKSKVSSRFSNLKQYNEGQDGSTSFRYQINSNASDIIGDNWMFGVGVGAEQKYLMEFYKARDWKYALKGGFNTHNQFLQTFLSIGITGFLVLVALLFVPLFMKGFEGDKIMLLCFTFLFCTEAMLERQAGTVLFLVFYVFSFTLRGNREVEAIKQKKLRLKQVEDS